MSNTSTAPLVLPGWAAPCCLALATWLCGCANPPPIVAEPSEAGDIRAFVCSLERGRGVATHSFVRLRSDRLEQLGLTQQEVTTALYAMIEDEERLKAIAEETRARKDANLTANRRAVPLPPDAKKATINFPEFLRRNPRLADLFREGVLLEEVDADTRLVYATRLFRLVLPEPRSPDTSAIEPQKRGDAEKSH